MQQQQQMSKSVHWAPEASLFFASAGGYEKPGCTFDHTSILTVPQRKPFTQQWDKAEAVRREMNAMCMEMQHYNQQKMEEMRLLAQQLDV